MVLLKSICVLTDIFCHVFVQRCQLVVTVIKSIKEGDTTLTYAVGQGEDTPENRFDSFVKQLERGYDKWITPHRRLRW